MQGKPLNVWMLAAWGVLMAGPAGAERIVYPEAAGAVNVREKYGAKGDGVTDDTTAIQKAIDENKGKNRVLYFPDGVYVLSGGVGIFGGKAHSSDRFLHYQGQSEAGTVLKLRDNCNGFADAATPKIVLSVYQGQSTGDVMQSYVKNLTVDVGSGNPGAVGLRFMTNNVGAMERVTIRSSDPAGAGAIGLDLRQSQNGPGLIKHVTVRGFDMGVATNNSFSLVLEHLTLVGQREVGFWNKIARVTLRGLRSENTVPAIKNGQHAHLTLIDAELTGGAADNVAIITADPKIYLRDIRQSGYGHIVQDPQGNSLAGERLDEWYLGKGQSLFGHELASLRLPIEETPEIPWEEDLSKWAWLEDGGEVTEDLQALIDDAAAKGKTTICFPKGPPYRLSGPIRVHGSINRIVGMSNLVDVTDPDDAFKNGAALFTFENLTSDALVIERFFLLGGWKVPPHVAMFDNKSDAAIVVKNLGVGGQLKKPNPGKRWFIEDISPGRECTLQIAEGERVWARQYNPETYLADMVHVTGGTFWCLGLKTEGRTTHVLARDGAKVEVIGGVSYQSWGKQKLDPPLFKIIDSDLSATLGFYHHDTPFATIVEETLNGQTRTLARKDLAGYHLPLYRSGGSPSP